MRGWDTVTVPGAVAGWGLLHDRLGRLPFADVLAPAIEYAERGFAVSAIVQDKWRRAIPLLKDGPGFAAHFMPKGRAPEIGEHFTLAGAARTFKLLARHGAAAFYQGEIAAAIERHARATGGALTAADFADYWDFVRQHGWVETISTQFHGHELHEIPPNGQGIAALSCLGILRHTALADYAVDSADWQHVAIEAMKLAFADTYAYVADPRTMAVTPAMLLDDAYLAQRARSIDMQQGPGCCGRHSAPWRHDLPHHGRCERHDGLADPVELHGLRFGRRRAGLRHFIAEPRPWLRAASRQSQRRRAGQAPVSYDHSRVPDEGRTACDELRRDGRQHAATGSRANAATHAACPPATAGRL